jgi:hypothetical protein
MDDIRNYNIGKSDYSRHKIQPWDIWLEYNLNPWDADIIKRILRTKEEPNMTPEESRILDYRKIIHICKERIRQLKPKQPSVTFELSEIESSKLLKEENVKSVTFEYGTIGNKVILTKKDGTQVNITDVSQY